MRKAVFGLIVGLLAPRVSAQSFNPLIQSLMDSVSQPRLEAHIKALVYAGGESSRVALTAGNDSAVAYIGRYLKSLRGLTSVEYDTFFVNTAQAPYNTKPMVNVVATLTGQIEPSKIHLLGGHLDCSASREGATVWNSTWKTIRAPGADDNASGVAAILEIARLLSDTASNYRNDYTIRFVAFNVEEYGPAYSGHHLGSAHLAQEAKGRGEQIQGAIVVDMIGYTGTAYDYVNVVSNTPSESLGRSLLWTNFLYGLGLETNGPPFPDATYSDHESFWTQGYPAVLLIENAPPWDDHLPYYRANPYYHKSSDTFETLNMATVTKVTQMVLGTLATLGQKATNVAERETPATPKGYSLSQSYPNPFNARTVIRYDLASSGYVQLTLHDLLGRGVRTLVDGVKSSGTHRVAWDGRDALGKLLPSGIYICRLKAGEAVLQRKLVFQK